MQPVSNFRHSVCSKGPPRTSAVQHEGSRCVTTPERSLIRRNDRNRKEESQSPGEVKGAAAAAAAAVRAARGREEKRSRKWRANGVDEKTIIQSAATSGIFSILPQAAFAFSSPSCSDGLLVLASVSALIPEAATSANNFTRQVLQHFYPFALKLRSYGDWRSWAEEKSGSFGVWVLAKPAPDVRPGVT